MEKELLITVKESVYQQFRVFLKAEKNEDKFQRVDDVTMMEHFLRQLKRETNKQKMKEFLLWVYFFSGQNENRMSVTLTVHPKSLHEFERVSIGNSGRQFFEDFFRQDIKELSQFVTNSLHLEYGFLNDRREMTETLTKDEIYRII